MIESVQYNAALAITGAIHGSSRDKLYQELVSKVFMIDDGLGNYAFIIKFGTTCVHFI